MNRARVFADITEKKNEHMKIAIEKLREGEIALQLAGELFMAEEVRRKIVEAEKKLAQGVQMLTAMKADAERIDKEQQS